MLVYDPYYDIKAVSNSALQHINPEQDGSPTKFKQHWDGKLPGLKTSALEFGNLAHLAVLEPHLLNYVVDKTNTPDKIRDIVKEVFEVANKQTDMFDLDKPQVIGAFETYYPAIISACEKYSYGATWKEETRLNKVMEKGGSYFSLLTDSKDSGKFVITSAQEERLNHVVTGVTNDKLGVTFMTTESTEPDVEYFHEKEVVWQEDKYSFPLKGKLDRLRVDHANKEFTVMDLKTTGKSLASFSDSFEKYHYARQVAAYELAASKWCKQEFNEVYKPSHRHVILAVETKGDYRAAKFVIKRSTINAGKEEYFSLLDRLQHHFETGDWVNDYEYATNGAYYI